MLSFQVFFLFVASRQKTTLFTIHYQTDHSVFSHPSTPRQLTFIVHIGYSLSNILPLVINLNPLESTSRSVVLTPSSHLLELTVLAVMDQSYYEIDPLGDLELVVNRSEPTILEMVCHEAPARPEEPKLGYWSDEDDSVEPEKKGSRNRKRVSPSDKNPTLTATQRILAAAKSSESNQNPDIAEIRLRVDSKTLSRTSPYFRGMLHGGFKEAKELQSGNLPRIKTDNCQTKALIVMLDFLRSTRVIFCSGCSWPGSSNVRSFSSRPHHLWLDMQRALLSTL